MLWAIDGGRLKQIEDIPHQDNYSRLLSSLSKKEYEDIYETLNNKIETNEVHTSSWMPGHNWNGTVYEPIYTKAANNNRELSGLLFGIIVWVIMMERDDYWSFGRYKKGDVDIKGMTYFKINNPNEI
jgi:hypothetical protein